MNWEAMIKLEILRSAKSHQISAESNVDNAIATLAIFAAPSA